MDAPRDGRPRQGLDTFLAGLQAGTLGTLWMLAWMGLCSALERRSFWMPENLLATALRPRGEIAVDFTWSTVSGLALYLVIYSLWGAAFALVACRTPMTRARTSLLALVFALAWYYLAFHYLWKTISPPIALLDLTRVTVVGHLIYGLVVGRFDRHLPRAESPVSEAVVVPLAEEPAPPPEPRA